MTEPVATFFAKNAFWLQKKFNFAVFPLKERDKDPVYKGGYKIASTDPNQILEWAKRHAQANVGIATGAASGVVVIDLDSLRALAADHKPGEPGVFAHDPDLVLPPTFTVETHKGRHYYYRLNGTPIGRLIRPWGSSIEFDVSGDNGYVVGPGSIHPDSTPENPIIYRIWSNAPIADLPKELERKLLKKAPPPPRDDQVITNPAQYIAKAVEAACREIEMCPQGERNKHANRKAISIGRYVGANLLKRQDAYDWLLESALKAGLEEDEAIRAITNGLDFGETVPKHLKTVGRYQPSTLKRKDVDDQIVLDLCDSDEIGDATLFCQLLQGQRLYDHYAKSWLSYMDGRWQRDETEQTTKEVYDHLRDTYLPASNRLDNKAREIRAKAKEALSETDLADLKKFEKQRDVLRDRVRKLGSSARLNNVLSLSRGMLPARSTEFDADPFLLNLRNGTYNLRALQFQPHSPKDMMTKMSPVHYDADADCPRWELFVFEICKDDWDLVMYLKKICGLFLTGRADYQYLFFFYGNGNNGKGTFFNTLHMILNDFYITLSVEILLAKNKSGSDEYHLAQLKGSRLVVSSEIPANRRLNESLVKDLTGNDFVSARNPHEKPFQYKPTHKLCLVGNHKPNIPGLDRGIWRRIRLFPFLHSFPEGVRQMEDVLEEFREESSGILNWMIDGYRLLQEEGLEMPEAVKNATEAYRQESDSIGVFLEECTEAVPTAFYVTTKQLWTAYNHWCEENGERVSVANNRQFATTLREKGLEVRPGTSNKLCVFGMKLMEKGGVS